MNERERRLNEIRKKVEQKALEEGQIGFIGLGAMKEPIMVPGNHSKTNSNNNTQSTAESSGKKTNAANYLITKVEEGVASVPAALESGLRISAAREMEQAEKASQAKGPWDALYRNTLGAGVDTLNEFQWDKDKKFLGNVANLAGTFIDATGEFATGILGVEAIKNLITDKNVRKAAEKNNISVAEQYQLEKEALTSKNLSSELLGLEELQAFTNSQRDMQGKAVQTAGDVIGAVSNMAPAIAVSALTKNPAAGRYVSALTAAGGKMQEAVGEGADVGEARRAGLLTGAVEYGTETAFAGIPLLDGKTGAVTSGVKKILPQKAAATLEAFGKTKGGKAAAWAAEKLGEGGEEVLNEVLDTYISRTYDPDAAPATAKELIDTFGLSTAVSIILGGIPGKTNTDTNINTNAQPNVGKSSLSGASPNATMTAKGGMQNGPKTAGQSIGIITESHGGLGAGADAGNPGVGQSSPGRVPVWGQVLGDSRPSAGMLEGSAGSVLGDKENGLARRSEQNGVVSGSGIPEITKRLKAAGTAVIDDNGEPILLTHWTPNMDFTEFGEGDVGFHFGSREQAENRAEKQAGSSNAGRYIQAYLDIKNPAYVQTDGMGWNAAQAAYALSRWGGIITFDDFLTIQQMAISENVKANDSSGGSYNTESSKALRDLLESYGYDGIVYENEFEGEGKSYVAFHPEQVIWIDDGTGRGGDTDRLNQETTDGPQDLSDADTPPTDTLALNLLHSTQEKQSVKDRVKSGVANLRRRLVNIGDSMERIDKLVGGHRNRNNYQNVIQARNRANFAIGEQGARRNGGYQTDLQGNRIGDSLADIFAPIHSQGEAVAQEFQDYLRHWHNIDRTAVKKPVFDESVTADVSREKIAEYEAAHPEFRESAEKVWAYNANLVEILVEGGVLDRGTADLLHNMYPHYVPSHVDGNTTGPYASIHNTQSGVLQKATGKKDAAAMRPIHEIMARQTINVYRQTAMNQLGNSLLDSLLSGADGVRQYLDVTSTKSDAVDMRLGILDETLTQEDYKAGLNKDGTLTFYRNGEKTTVALSKDIIEALNGLFKGTDFFDSTTGKVLTAPATIMRNLITTYNPAFTAANFLRDAGDSLLFTKSLPHFIQAYPQAIQEILKNGELFQKYQALGGFSSGMFDSRTGAFDSGNLGLQTPGQKTKGKVKQNTVGRIEALNSVVEQIPRFTEFLATLNRTGDFSHDGLMEAMYNAADITVNFGRSGDVGNTVNRFTPFFNAAIQGLDKVVRTAVETKSGKTWLRMIGVATVLGFIPQAINEALYGDDEEYQNIPLRDKANNYLFRMPNGNYIKLPRGRMIAALSGLGQSVINLFDGRDPEFEESLSLIIDNLAPQSPIENNMLYAFQRADLFDPESQGKTWFGGDIETQSDLNTAPKYRYDENTSRWMVALGQATGLSPKKLQDLFETYSGVIGDVVVPLTTPAAEKGAFGGLFRNRFTLDPTYSNTLSSDFYDAKQEYAWSKNDPSTDLQEREISATVSRFINNKQSEISSLYDEIEAVQNSNLPDREKLEQVDNLRDQINEVYREALQAMPGYEEAATNLYDSVGKDLSLGTNPQRETSDDLVDELYLMANREAFGSEYALQEYNKDVYEAAQELNRKDRISYDRIFDFYMHVRQVRDEGLTGSEENAKIREYILGVPGLSSQQKQALDESFLSDGRWIPTDMQVDYSDEESFFITQLSSGAQKAWDRFGRYADWEVDPETFSELWDVGHTDGVSKDEKLELWRAMTGWNDSRLQTFWNIMQGNKGYE